MRINLVVILKLALSLMLMLILVACGDETGSATPDVSSVKPTVLSANSSLVAPVTAATGVNSGELSVQPQIQSQGLGLSKTAWEKLRGPGLPVAPGLPSFQFEEGQYLVIIANDKIAQIERRWISQPTSLDQAKAEGKLLYPADTKFVKSMLTATKDNIDVFFSDEIKQAFASIPNSVPLWPGGVPGNFTVTYREADNHQIESIVIALGVNPT